MTVYTPGTSAARSLCFAPSAGRRAASTRPEISCLGSKPPRVLASGCACGFVSARASPIGCQIWHMPVFSCDIYLARLST